MTDDERRVLALVASGVDYAVPIAEATGWDLPRCWAVLHALEGRGLLTSREEPDETGERGGRARVRYAVRPPEAAQLPTPRPCPFCGAPPVVRPGPEDSGNAWGMVECSHPGCPTWNGREGVQVRDGEDVADDRGSDLYKAAAIRRWNAWSNVIAERIADRLGEALGLTRTGMDDFRALVLRIAAEEEG